MNAPLPPLADFCSLADAETLLADLARAIARPARSFPISAPAWRNCRRPVPMTPEALAAFFGTKVALPRRAKGNPWAAAQHIESISIARRSPR